MDASELEALAVFAREANVLARLDHPNIVKLLGGRVPQHAGTLAAPQDAVQERGAGALRPGSSRLKSGAQQEGPWFYVMELADGGPLTRYLRTSGAESAAAAVAMAASRPPSGAAAAAAPVPAAPAAPGGAASRLASAAAAGNSRDKEAAHAGADAGAALAAGTSGAATVAYAPEAQAVQAVQAAAAVQPLELREVLAVGSAVARALACLHVHGVMHRDVKPDNVLVVWGEDAPPQQQHGPSSGTGGAAAGAVGSLAVLRPEISSRHVRLCDFGICAPAPPVPLEKKAAAGGSEPVSAATLGSLGPLSVLTNSRPVSVAQQMGLDVQLQRTDSAGMGSVPGHPSNTALELPVRKSSSLLEGVHARPASQGSTFGAGTPRAATSAAAAAAAGGRPLSSSDAPVVEGAAGTAAYAAPECFDPSLGPCTCACDVYSLACLLWVSAHAHACACCFMLQAGCPLLA